MGYTDATVKNRSKIWANPIYNWTADYCDKYMKEHQIPRNPVKDKMCISGECLCGAFAGKEEWAELKFNYPEVAARIQRLHEIAKENGKPWGWSSGPTEWRKEQKMKNQMSMPMCVGCETKNTYL